MNSNTVNTLPAPSIYRELLDARETNRDAIADCLAHPDKAMAYFLPSYRRGFAQADNDLRAYVVTQRTLGNVLCPVTLEWRKVGDTEEDRENTAETAALDREQREQEAAFERAYSVANERAYSGSVD